VAVIVLCVSVIGKAKCDFLISPQLHHALAQMGDEKVDVASIARLDGTPVSAPQPLRDPR